MNRWILMLSVLGVCLFTYLTRGVLLPFVAGLAIAYFLDPVADALEKRRVPRGMAAALIIGLFFTSIVGVATAMWPIIQSQLAAAAKTLPETIANVKPWLTDFMATLVTDYGVDFGTDLDNMLAGVSDELLTQAKSAASGAVKGSLALFNVMTLILISPVVAFYLLRDWDLIIQKLNDWLPTNGGAVVREQAQKIDNVLAGFVRGQLLVSTFMGVLYGVGWALTGLDFAIVLGLLAGVMSFIPFVGTLVAAVVAVGMAIGQWGFDPMQLALVIGVFFVVQTIEGAFLTPRLIGERVGLHPVWVLFAVFAGGEVMGFVGVLVAVPLAAAIAVLVRYWIERYLAHYQEIRHADVSALSITEDKKEAPHKPRVDATTEMN